MYHMRQHPVPSGHAILPGSLLSVSWQIIGKINPGQAIFDPGVITRRDDCGLVKTANSDIDLIGLRFRYEDQRRPALRTERTQTPSPFHLAGLSADEANVASAKRCPGDEWGTATPAAVQTMAVRYVVGLPRRLVAHSAAQAAPADEIRVHCATIDESICESSTMPCLHNRNLPVLVLCHLNCLW